MKNLYTRKDLLELLSRSHAALEAVTDRAGCDFLTAVVLCDCQNAINNHDQKIELRSMVITEAAALVH